MHLPLISQAWETSGSIRIAPYDDRAPQMPALARLLALLEQMAGAIDSLPGVK
jgi:hypothetical protein